MTRAEIVLGYQRIERHRDRLLARQSREVTQRILGGGVFEERTYEDGRLVAVQRFTLGPAAGCPRAQGIGGRKVA